MPKEDCIAMTGLEEQRVDIVRQPEEHRTEKVPQTVVRCVRWQARLLFTHQPPKPIPGR